MPETGVAVRSTRFEVGWWILFVISALAVANHAVLIFTIAGQEVLFIGWTGLCVYSTVVLYIPYRRGERWAWYSTWVLIACFGVLILPGAEIGLMYLIAAALMAVGQLLTRASFFSDQ